MSRSRDDLRTKRRRAKRQRAWRVKHEIESVRRIVAAIESGEEQLIPLEEAMRGLFTREELRRLPPSSRAWLEPLCYPRASNPGVSVKGC